MGQDHEIDWVRMSWFSCDNQLNSFLFLRQPIFHSELEENEEY